MNRTSPDRVTGKCRSFSVAGATGTSSNDARRSFRRFRLAAPDHTGVVKHNDGCPLCGGEVELVVLVDVTSTVEQFSPSKSLAVGRCQLCNEQLHRPQGQRRWQGRRFIQQAQRGRRRLP